MPEIDLRPANGSGSCARCRGSLGLSAVKRGDTWYCDPDCAQGRTAPGPREPSVPETWLYARPRRFFRKRMPKELNSAGA